MSILPFPFKSLVVNVLVTSIDGSSGIIISVPSSTVFPSVSSPSSEVSVTLLVRPPALPTAYIEFETNPLFAVALVIV